MIFTVGLLLLFFQFVVCDEHIQQEHGEHSPNLPPEKSESEIKDSQVIIQNIPKEVIESNIHPLEYISPKYENVDSPPNFGINSFRDSSYIAFTILVGKRNVDCYFYKARKSFDIDFQVLRGGDYDIALSIFDINNNKVAFHNPAGDGNLKIPVPAELIDTDYSICLDNQQASWHTKKVFIMIDVEGPNGINHPDLQFGEYGQVHQHLNKLDLMNSALSNVYQSLMKVEQLQERRRLVEAVDRSIMEGNFEYVTVWAIIQISLMLIVSGLQLVMIRSLFDSRGGVCSKIWIKLSEISGGRL